MNIIYWRNRYPRPLLFLFCWLFTRANVYPRLLLTSELQDTGVQTLGSALMCKSPPGWASKCFWLLWLDVAPSEGSPRCVLWYHEPGNGSTPAVIPAVQGAWELHGRGFPPCSDSVSEHIEAETCLLMLSISLLVGVTGKGARTICLCISDDRTEKTASVKHQPQVQKCILFT